MDEKKLEGNQWTAEEMARFKKDPRPAPRMRLPPPIREKITSATDYGSPQTLAGSSE